VPFSAQIKVFGIVLLMLYGDFLFSLLRLQEHGIAYFLASVGNTITLTAFNILFLVRFKQGYNSYLNSLLLGSGAIFIFCIAHCLRQFKTLRIDLRQLRFLLLLGIQVIPNGLLALLAGTNDKYFMNLYLSASAVGIYSMGFRFGNLIDPFLTKPIGQALYPKGLQMYATSREAFSAFTENVFFIYLLVASCFVLAFFTFGDLVFHVFINAMYWESYRVVPMIMAGYYVAGCSQMLSSVIIVNEKIYLFVILTIVSSAVNIALNVLLIPRIGLIGAALSLLSAQIVVFSLQYIVCSRLMPLSVFSPATIFLVVATVASCVLTLLLSSVAEVRPLNMAGKAGLLVGFIGVALAVNRNRIRRVLRDLQ
jgi:O-antigen/teichoic acid export membrane protein